MDATSRALSAGHAHAGISCLGLFAYLCIAFMRGPVVQGCEKQNKQNGCRRVHRPMINSPFS